MPSSTDFQNRTNPTNIIQTKRPGRKFHTPHIDIDLDRAYGRPWTEKADTDLRIYFQNVKGLTYSATGEDYNYYLSSIRPLQTDIVGMAETNTAWTHSHLTALFKARANQQFQSAKLSFSSPHSDTDPIPTNETYQSGGTLTMTTDAMVSMALGTDIQDPTGLGRWSGQTYRGKDNKLFSVITAYRVCTGSIATSSVGSAFSREYEHLRTSTNEKSPRPRKAILNDLQHLIETLQSQGHATLLMLDSNGSLADDVDLQDLLTQCDLHDLHATNAPPSTFIGSNTRRIDHILGCSSVLQCMTGSGSLSYLEGPQSDHRGIFVDLDQLALLGHQPQANLMATAPSRILKSGNPELVELYQEAMHKYYQDHDMISRIEEIKDKADTMTKTELRIALEKWDSDQGRAMHFAEASLAKPRKPYAWSPALRDAGLIYRYWRLRLREHQKHEDYAQTFDRMEQLIQQHDPSFQLPQRTTAFTEEELKAHLNTATTSLKECQKDSVEARFRSYLDLLAGYENDKDPTTKADSARKAKIVKNTVRSERSRAMYQNIRQVTKPQTKSSLRTVMVPRHRNNPALPDDFQDLLATTDAEDIVWDTLLDKESIEHNLLK
jgi:hypothetical protein